MRILVMGANGMIGHRIWLAAQERFETWGTLRTASAGKPWASLFDSPRVIEGVPPDDPASIAAAFEVARPDVVINAIGLIKQREIGSDTGAAFTANSFLPHYLRDRADASGAKLVQISTDCVFTGNQGGYTESDSPDALDVYGLTKRLGEVTQAPHLTIRTSALGRSLSGTDGLLEWFLNAPAAVTGYRRAVFSGLTTPTLAETILDLVERHADLTGLFHIASEPINKYELLVRVARALGHSMEITPADLPVIDRSLDDTAFRGTTGIPRPDWDAMLAGLAADPTPYATLRGN